MYVPFSRVTASKLFVSATVALIAFGIATIAVAAIVSGTSTSNVSSHLTITLLTVNRPTVSTGDVMIASIAVNDGTIANVTAPSGWALIARTDNDINVSLLSYWKVAGASEPSTYTWTIDEQTKAVGGITPYSGVDATNPIDAVAGNTGFGTIATTSAITTSTANAEIIALFATDVNKSFSTPTGMNLKYNPAHSGGPSTAAFDALQAIVGTVASKSSTIAGNNSRNWAAQQIALRGVNVVTVPTPVAYWKMDGNSNDAVGSNNGSDTNVSYSTSTGKINQGAGFDGSASRINIGNMVSGQVDVSVGAWIKTTFTPDAQVGNVQIVGQRQGPNPQWILFEDQNGKVGFFAFGTSGDAANFAGNTTITDGNWHYVGVAQSGTTYTMYVDGAVDATATGPAITYDSSGGSIGYDRKGYEALGSGSGHWFNGSIDEVSVWNTSLSASDFSTLYNSGAGDQYPF